MSGERVAHGLRGSAVRLARLPRMSNRRFAPNETVLMRVAHRRTAESFWLKIE